MTPEKQLLVEQVTSAHRELGVDGTIRAHRAWFDLDDAGRIAAFDATLELRKLEVALDGESSTVRAVMSRLRR